MDTVLAKDLIADAIRESESDPWTLVTTGLSVKSQIDAQQLQSLAKGAGVLDHIRQVYSWFTWNEPVGVYSESLGPLHFMFPFYRTVIVPVYPYRSVELFVQAYGMTPELMARLSRLGFVNLLLVGAIEKYRRPHLNPLATSGHLAHILQLSQAEAQIRGLDMQQIQLEYELKIRRLFSRDSALAKLYPRVDLRTRLIELHLLGFERLIDRALRFKKRPGESIAVLLSAHRVLAEPYFRGLNVFYNSDFETWNIARKRLKKHFPVILEGEKDLILPAGLLRQFSLEFEFIPAPALLDPVGYCTSLANSAEVNENHALLMRLTRLLQERNYSAADATGAEIADHVVRHLNSRVASLDRSRKRAKVALSLGLCVGVGRGLDTTLKQLLPSVALPPGSLEVTTLLLEQAMSGPIDKLSALMARSTVGFDSLPVLLWQRQRGHPWKRR